MSGSKSARKREFLDDPSAPATRLIRPVAARQVRRGFFMVGQWVEPGESVPTALMSGPHAVQLLCAHAESNFAPPFASRS